MSRFVALQKKPSQPNAGKTGSRPSTPMRSPRAPGSMIAPPWGPSSGLSDVLRHRLLSPSPVPRHQVQAKLEVSDPGDALEIEADQVADQVMRMTDATADVAPLARRSGDRVH